MKKRRRSRATTAPDFQSLEVASVFADYPDVIRERLLRLRELIFETAELSEGVGELEEALRWGEPSYLTSRTKSGTTIRIHSKEPERYGMYFHCQTDLIARFRLLFPDRLQYEGNRCITFGLNDVMPEDLLRECIALALTYHLDKRR